MKPLELGELEELLWLQGDEDGGVGLRCRGHLDGGRPLAYYDQELRWYPDPLVRVVATVGELLETGRCHVRRFHPPADGWAPGSFRPLLVLDLDGTVRYGLEELGRFVNTPRDVVLFREVTERMRAWRAAGGRIIGVTNQGGVALGHVSEANVQAAISRTNELTGNLFDLIVYCPHAPSPKGSRTAGCWCRKPAPGNLLRAIEKLEDLTGEHYPPDMALVVGDRPEDEGLADALDMTFQSAKGWREGYALGWPLTSSDWTAT